MTIFFDREKLKAKKETTFNLLNDRTCDNCVYYMPIIYSIALRRNEHENCIREKCPYLN